MGSSHVSSRAALLLVLSLSTGAPIPSAVAQYLYLDTNGDSLNTSADVLNPSGTTTIDVWLRTDGDRDGTPAPCDESTQARDATSFTLALEAVGGTVSWSGLIVTPGGGRYCPWSSHDATNFYSGFCDIVDLPPGLHWVGSLEVLPLSGTPSIIVVPVYPGMPSGGTAFGSHCPDSDGGNTHRLGSEWSDADGIRYGGWPSPPLLDQPAAMQVAEGAVGVQRLHAIDPDGDAVTFSKLRGPDFLTVMSGPSGKPCGVATLAPGHRDAGRTQAIVAVGDGVGMDIRAFAIRVLDVNGPPTIDSIPDVCLGRPGRVNLQVGVADPDGDDALIIAAGLPPGAVFTTFPSSLGGGYARIGYTTDPGSREARYQITLTASDGALTSSRSFELRVDRRCDGLSSSVRVEPNPMRSRGTMTFRMMAGGPYRVSVYDVRGRLVKRLDAGSVPTASDVAVTLDMGEAGDHGSGAAGVYFYMVETRQGIARGRFVVVR